MKEKYPEKFQARKLFREAIRKGIIIPQPCEMCGEKKSEGHHPDYSKPYEVKWLCRYHHKLVEGKIVFKRKEKENDHR